MTTPICTFTRKMAIDNIAKKNILIKKTGNMYQDFGLIKRTRFYTDLIIMIALRIFCLNVPLKMILEDLDVSRGCKNSQD